MFTETCAPEAVNPLGPDQLKISEGSAAFACKKMLGLLQVIDPPLLVTIGCARSEVTCVVLVVLQPPGVVATSV